MTIANRIRTTMSLARHGLAAWNVRQWRAAALAAGGTAFGLGVATVLIPNPVFGRDIAPVWWNYPVWLAASALTGLLVASYVRTGAREAEPTDRQAKRSGILGTIGAMAAWFAVGCPVCNKIALLALGYSGAIQYFAPAQLWLGLAALLLSTVALVYRLAGQVACPASAGST